MVLRDSPMPRGRKRTRELVPMNPSFDEDLTDEPLEEDTAQPEDPPEFPLRPPRKLEHTRFRRFRSKKQNPLPDDESFPSSFPAWMTDARLIPKKPPGKV